jgi:hypothetical protein
MIFTIQNDSQLIRIPMPLFECLISKSLKGFLKQQTLASHCFNNQEIQGINLKNNRWETLPYCASNTKSLGRKKDARRERQSNWEPMGHHMGELYNSIMMSVVRTSRPAHLAPSSSPSLEPSAKLKPKYRAQTQVPSSSPSAELKPQCHTQAQVPSQNAKLEPKCQAQVQVRDAEKETKRKRKRNYPRKFDSSTCFFTCNSRCCVCCFNHRQSWNACSFVRSYNFRRRLLVSLRDFMGFCTVLSLCAWNMKRSILFIDLAKVAAALLLELRCESFDKIVIKG